jgi:hypothetical protein
MLPLYSISLTNQGKSAGAVEGQTDEKVGISMQPKRDASFLRVAMDLVTYVLYGGGDERERIAIANSGTR